MLSSCLPQLARRGAAPPATLQPAGRPAGPAIPAAPWSAAGQLAQHAGHRHLAAGWPAHARCAGRLRAGSSGACGEPGRRLRVHWRLRQALGFVHGRCLFGTGSVHVCNLCVALSCMRAWRAMSAKHTCGVPHLPNLLPAAPQMTRPAAGPAAGVACRVGLALYSQNLESTHLELRGLMLGLMR